MLAIASDNSRRYTGPMTQPPAYVRDYSFTDFSSRTPAGQQPGVKLDAEFDAIGLTTDRIRDNLALIQRDDGALANGLVGISQLSASALALLGSLTVSVRGPWVTAHAYVVGDVISSGSTVLYLCMIAHTSGTLATDVAAGKFVLIFDPENTALEAALASGAGAAGIGVTGQGPSVIRSLQSILNDGLELKKDFGAIGDGTTNNGSKVKNALEEALSIGTTLYASGGVFKFDQKADITLPTTGIFDGGLRPSIRGVGANATVLMFTGADTDDAIRIEGTAPGADEITLSGFRLQRPNTPLSSSLGAGIVVEKMNGLRIEGVVLFNHGDAIRTKGVLLGSFAKVLTNTCHTAWNLQQGFTTAPNVISFDQCTAAVARDYGIYIDQGCQINLRNSTIEGMGTHSGNGLVGSLVDPASTSSIYVYHGGREGAMVLNCIGGNYFEANKGHEIYIRHSPDYPARFNLSGSNFNRFDATTSAIVFDDTDCSSGTAEAVLDISGATATMYQSGSVYTPSSSRPLLKADLTSTFDRLTVIDRDFLYAVSGNTAYDWRNTPERPAYGSKKVRRANEPITVTYAGTWGNTVGAGFEFEATRDLDGWVTLAGFVGGGTTTDGSTMFTLPAGCRPAQTYLPYTCVAQTGACIVRVLATGVVSIYSASGAAFVSLAGIRFKAA